MIHLLNFQFLFIVFKFIFPFTRPINFRNIRPLYFLFSIIIEARYPVEFFLFRYPYVLKVNFWNQCKINFQTVFSN